MIKLVQVRISNYYTNKNVLEDLLIYELEAMFNASVFKTFFKAMLWCDVSYEKIIFTWKNVAFYYR